MANVSRGSSKRWTWERQGDTSRLNGPVTVRKLGEDEIQRMEAADPRLDPRRYAGGKLRRRILIRDGYHCRYCQAPLTDDTANIDHVKPWKHGGRTTKDNLVACCRTCNWLKANKHGKKWRPKPLKRHHELLK